MKVHHISRSRNARLRSYTLCSLPGEVLIQLFKYLPLRDLLNSRQVCCQFKWLIDSSPHLWTMATLVDEWPNDINFKHFKRAADMDNVEALIKLGIACLYSEGLPESFDNDTNSRGQHAAEYLCRAERLVRGVEPFVWALIRPPWSKNGTCCKAIMYRLLKNLAINSQECDKTVLYCIASISTILEEEDDCSLSMSDEVKLWLTRAAKQGSHAAAMKLWQHNHDNCSDAAANLISVRQLRELVATGDSKTAKMQLYSAYAKGRFGGLLPLQVASATRTYIQESSPTASRNLFNVQSKLNPEMRYILVDWLVEVAGMKGYSSYTLHVVVSCIDRYLMHKQVSRGNLQLVGITAMVICSRLLESELITIREAAWLTDGTYKYETVVRMMGDILATLHGRIIVLLRWDYLMLYCQLAKSSPSLKYLCLYISELTLLHVDLSRYSAAHQAAGVFLLASVITAAACTWTSKLVDYTGFQAKDLVPCVLHIHEKCFTKEAHSYHISRETSAIKQRYSHEDVMEVSRLPVLDHATLRSQLCLDDHKDRDSPSRCTQTPCGQVEPFLMSPSRSTRSTRHQHEYREGSTDQSTLSTTNPASSLESGYVAYCPPSPYRHQQETRLDRDDVVTTPTGGLETCLSTSFMSGYDADMESDAEGDQLTDNNLASEDPLWLVQSSHAAHLPRATFTPAVPWQYVSAHGSSGVAMFRPARFIPIDDAINTSTAVQQCPLDTTGSAQLFNISRGDGTSFNLAVPKDRTDCSMPSAVSEVPVAAAVESAATVADDDLLTSIDETACRFQLVTDTVGINSPHNTDVPKDSVKASAKIVPAWMQKDIPNKTAYSGRVQSFKIDSNGKLRLGSPRQPLKRLENSPSRHNCTMVGSQQTLT